MKSKTNKLQLVICYDKINPESVYVKIKAVLRNFILNFLNLTIWRRVCLVQVQKQKFCFPGKKH